MLSQNLNRNFDRILPIISYISLAKRALCAIMLPLLNAIFMELVMSAGLSDHALGAREALQTNAAYFLFEQKAFCFDLIILCQFDYLAQVEQVFFIVEVEVVAVVARSLESALKFGLIIVLNEVVNLCH